MGRLLVLAVVLAVGGCASMQEQYNIRRDNVSCAEANRYAFRSVRSLGYSITEFRLAEVGREGIIKGTKPGERDQILSGTVSIRCEPGEVYLSAWQDRFLSQDLTFSRGFFLTFTSLADHAAENAAWAEEKSGGVLSGGAKFKMQPQLGLESKLDFGEDLAAAGILAVKVKVQNGSDRTYIFDPAAIDLRTAKGGGKVAQMGVAAAAAAIAREAATNADEGALPPDPRQIEKLLRERALTARTLRPGEQVEGFVYFPVGQYKRARATLVDSETSEAEGFIVEF